MGEGEEKADSKKRLQVIGSFRKKLDPLPSATKQSLQNTILQISIRLHRVGTPTFLSQHDSLGNRSFVYPYNNQSTIVGFFLASCSLLKFIMFSITQVPVRLNGARSNYSGRVEVFYSGKWGRICPNKWDIIDAQVICRQLGFKNAIAEFTGSDVEESKLPFLMSEVSCIEQDSELASCARIDGEVDCQSDVGAQALCEPCKK